jgi:3-oxoacyl-[acyl-carrier protein] reductase
MDEWRRIMRATTEGILFTIRTAVPAMKANRWGRIVNVSSIAVTDGMPGYAWYASVKSSLHGLTRTLAAELGPEGILVNVVMPGATLTDRVRNQFPPRTLEALASRLPLRRLPEPKEVAAATVFLCSEKNTVMTGEVLNVSGGRYNGS